MKKTSKKNKYESRYPSIQYDLWTMYDTFIDTSSPPKINKIFIMVKLQQLNDKWKKGRKCVQNIRKYAEKMGKKMNSFISFDIL